MVSKTVRHGPTRANDIGFGDLWGDVSALAPLRTYPNIPLLFSLPLSSSSWRTPVTLAGLVRLMGLAGLDGPSGSKNGPRWSQRYADSLKIASKTARDSPARAKYMGLGRLWDDMSAKAPLRTYRHIQETENTGRVIYKEDHMQ